MGMFDSTYLPPDTSVTCEKCGCPPMPGSRVEVQFKAYVGGCWNCPDKACGHFHDIWVRLERGVVVSVLPFVRDGEGYPVPRMEDLPVPRSAEKYRRRQAWLAEMRDRDAAEWRARRASYDVGDGLYSKLAAAMVEPIARRLDSVSIMRRMFEVTPLGTRRLGPYRLPPGGRWYRSESAPR